MGYYGSRLVALAPGHLRHQRVRRVQTQRGWIRQVRLARLQPLQRRRKLEHGLWQSWSTRRTEPEPNELEPALLCASSSLSAHRLPAQAVERLGTQRRRGVGARGTTPGTRHTSRPSRRVDRRSTPMCALPAGDDLSLAATAAAMAAAGVAATGGTLPSAHEWNHPVDAPDERWTLGGGGLGAPARRAAHAPVLAVAAPLSTAKSQRRRRACEPGAREP